MLEPPTTAEALGGSQLTLDCGARNIRVLWAFWGVNMTWGIACNAPPATLLANARDLCENRSTCAVDTGANSWLGYDPCDKPDYSEGCYSHPNNGNLGCIGRMKIAAIKYRCAGLGLPSNYCILGVLLQGQAGLVLSTLPSPPQMHCLARLPGDCCPTPLIAAGQY